MSSHLVYRDPGLYGPSYVYNKNFALSKPYTYQNWGIV